MKRCTSPWLLIASELGRSNADAWILEEGLACPNKHSLITYNGNTHPHQNPNRVLPNSSMYNSTLAMSLRCGRSHWLPLVAPRGCPSAPSPLPGAGGPSPAWICMLCHRTHQGQVPRVPTRTARGNQQRGCSLCYTLHSYPASFPNICVQKVPYLQEVLVLGMQHPANCPSLLSSQKTNKWWQQRRI